MKCPFDEDYFLRGIETGKSNYQNYRWLEQRTISFAKSLISVLDIQTGETVLDFGAALGFTVKALKRLGVDAWGYDISEWAVKNCDEEVKHRIHSTIQHRYYDHVFAKDVFEHIEPVILASMLPDLLAMVGKTMLIMVPLSDAKGSGKYLRKEDNLDATHIIRWPLELWMSFVQGCVNGEQFTVSGSWHVPGLKPTSLSYMKSCGFVLLRKHQCKS